MKVILGSANIEEHYKYPVVTFGNFDGIHRAHHKILKKVADTARKKNGTAILYTFDPHPVKLLSPELAPALLQTNDQKIEILDSEHIDVLVIEPFTRTLASLTSHDFFKKIIVKRLRAKEIVVGYDFTFGLHRTGKIEDLERMAGQSGINIHVMNAVFLKDSLISSTHIRHFIEKGNLKSAQAMLGRPYTITGNVIKGRGVGAELGFHTANLKLKNELIPPTGVYITTTKLKKSGKKLISITNIGYNPTFKGSNLSVETHILDFNEGLIDQEIEIEFFKLIRHEMTFNSINDLRNQIKKDITETRKFYEKRI